VEVLLVWLRRSCWSLFVIRMWESRRGDYYFGELRGRDYYFGELRGRDYYFGELQRRDSIMDLTVLSFGDYSVMDLTVLSFGDYSVMDLIVFRSGRRSVVDVLLLVINLLSDFGLLAIYRF
jgi:hypothetical protein